MVDLWYIWTIITNTVCHLNSSSDLLLCAAFQKSDTYSVLLVYFIDFILPTAPYGLNPLVLHLVTLLEKVLFVLSLEIRNNSYHTCEHGIITPQLVSVN